MNFFAKTLRLSALNNTRQLVNSFLLPFSTMSEEVYLKHDRTSFLIAYRVRESGRLMKGTEQSMKSAGHLCDSFVPMRDAPFLKTRIEKFDDLYAKYRATVEGTSPTPPPHSLAKPHDPIKVTLPDGSQKEAFAWKTTPLDIANSISAGLAQNVVAARV